MSYAEAGIRWDIKEDTIRKRAKRHKWATPQMVVRRIRQLSQRNPDALDKIAESWAEKGESHRKTAFDLASKSLEKMKVTTPKTWKDADIVDKIARRAAGLENAEIVNQTLVQVNEAIEEGEQPVDLCANEDGVLEPVAEAAG
jgi:hypothetical protein